MGMRPSQVLWQVELPLALPLIFVGIRTAAVYVVATATLAADRGRRRARRHHRQPGQLRPARGAGGGDCGRRARVRGRGAAGAGPAGRHAARAARCRRIRGWPSGRSYTLEDGERHQSHPAQGVDRMRRLILAVAIAGLTLGGRGLRKQQQRAAPAPAAHGAGRHHAGRREQARHGQAHRHARRQELHRGVRARAALQAGARGEGLHGDAEAEHRQLGDRSTRRSPAARSTCIPSTRA